MFASASVTDVDVKVSEAAAPPHVVVAELAAGTVRFAGSVMPKLDCVSAKPLPFDSITVSVDGELVAVFGGENDALTVGGAGCTLMAAGQAVALLPAAAGALLAAVVAVSVTVSVSTFPAESVTFKVKVPGAGSTLTRALFAPLTMRLDGDAVQA
jgi:hypothetical protein